MIAPPSLLMKRPASATFASLAPRRPAGLLNPLTQAPRSPSPFQPPGSPMGVPDSLRTALGDRYRLERQLGQGGMATVYLAQDLKHDRQVAIKVLRPELAAVLGRERFLAEIRLTAKLDHPHILTLIDSGEVLAEQDDAVEHGREAPCSFLYYVLPYIRGESLRR